MLALLKTVVLIKEAIKLAFFRLVEYLEHQHLWVRLQAQNGQKQRTFLWNLFGEIKVIPCENFPRNWRSGTTLCNSPFTVQRELALTRIERGVGGPGAQLSKRTSTLECLGWETDASQVLNLELHWIVTAKQQSICQQWRGVSGMLAF